MRGWLARLGRSPAASRFASVAELAAQLRTKIVAEGPTSPHRSTLLGQLAGVESEPGPADPGGPPDEPPARRAGFGAGRVYAHLIRTQGGLPFELLLPAAAYGAALTGEPAAHALREGGPPGLLKAHSAAAYAAGHRGGLSAEVELVLFRWLAWQRAIDVTPELLGRYEVWRTRRIARTDPRTDARCRAPGERPASR